MNNPAMQTKSGLHWMEWVGLMFTLSVSAIGFMLFAAQQGWTRDYAAIVRAHVWLLFVLGGLAVGATALGRRQKARRTDATAQLSMPKPSPVRRGQAIAVVLVCLFGSVVSVFVAPTFSAGVRSGSMRPSLLVGDQVYVTKSSRGFARGDVVLYRSREDETRKYIHRIIAVGGDTVAFEDGQVIVNGQRLAEGPTKSCPHREPPSPSLFGETPEASVTVYECFQEVIDDRPFTVLRNPKRQRRKEFEPIQLPEGYVYVVGDNRDNSADSRLFGPVKLSKVEGKVAFVGWSEGADGVRWDRFGYDVR